MNYALSRMSFVVTLLLISQANISYAQRYKRVHQGVLDLVTAGKADQAVARLKQLEQGKFDDGETQFMFAIAYARSGNNDAALAAMRSAVDMGLPPGRFVAGPRELFRPLNELTQYKELIERVASRPVHGPMLGDVRDTSAQIWLRTARESRVTVSVQPVSDDSIKITASERTRSDDDFTAVISVKGLEPSTDYVYTVAIDGNKVKPNDELQSFRTAPQKGSPCKFRLVFGGGAGYVPQNERMWNTIGSYDPDMLLLLGDNVYIDHPKSPAMQRYCYYRRQSRPEFRRLIARTPVYAIWDDHDFGTNDCTGGPDINTPAWKRPVWELFKDNWVNPPYGGGEENPGCYFDFYYGDVHFILLDGRFYRTGRGKPEATMLGPVQKQWLLKTIKASRGTFKVLISPVPWVFTAKGDSKDTWNGFRDERHEIFGFLAEHKIEGVVLISADRHRSDLWKIERDRAYSLYEFNSSRLTNQGIAGTQPHAEFSYNKKQSFGLVSFDTVATDPMVSYEVVTIDKETVHQFKLKRSQLTDR